MKSLLSVSVLMLVSVAWAADPPAMPKPEKEHEWLTKMFVGEWTMEGECFMEPGKPMKTKGNEVVKSLGGFWIVSDLKGESPMGPMQGIMTVGFDPARKKYTGSWVDSMTSTFWKYEGTVDSTGKILTLEADGPNMMVPGKTCKFRDTTEFKSADHRVMKSEMLGEDGKWITIMTMECKKKK